MMTRRSAGIGRVFLRRAARFVFLTNAFFILISLMALAEAVVLWLRWPHFASRSLPHKVSIGDFAISPDGEWGVSRISFHNGKRKEPAVFDVVLYNLRGQNAVGLQIGRYLPRYVAVSPVSDALAVTCFDGSLRTWSGFSDCKASHSVADERLRPFAQCDGLTRLAFSPDGRLLAATGRRFVYVWRWPSGELLHTRRLDEFAPRYLSFSSDSRQILSPGPKGEACLWNAYTGQTIEVISPDSGYVVNAAVSPDARLAAVNDGSQKVRVYSLMNDEELWCKSIWGKSFSFSADGRFLATSWRAGGHWLVNVFAGTSGQRICELRGHKAPITQLAFGPDGLLYSTDMRGVIRAWNIEHQREQWCFSTLAWASNNRIFHNYPEQLDPRNGRNDG
jgi:WD40 repeat protein